MGFGILFIVMISAAIIFSWGFKAIVNNDLPYGNSKAASIISTVVAYLAMITFIILTALGEKMVFEILLMGFLALAGTLNLIKRRSYDK